MSFDKVVRMSNISQQARTKPLSPPKLGPCSDELDATQSDEGN